MVKILELPYNGRQLDTAHQKRQDMRYVYKVTVGKPDGKKSLGRSTGEWEDEIG
jgi:hypothetical protein